MSEFLAFVGINVDTILACCALIVSIVAIVVAYLTLHSQNRHNRLSVRPIGRIGYHTKPDYIEVYVANDGVGPLLCKQLQIYTKEDNIKHSFEGLFLLSEEQKRFMSLRLASRKDFALPAGERFVFLEARAKDKDSEEGNAVREYIKETLGKVTLEFAYTDIYDQKMPVKIKSRWR
jgi:hypothetical protein